MRQNAAEMTSEDAPTPQAAGRGVRTGSILTLGSIANGLLAYVFFAVVTRALGADLAAPVAVLWAYWSFAGAALTFPLQHWIARTVAAHDGERAVRQGVAVIGGLALAASAMVGLIAWIFSDTLFGPGRAEFALLAAVVTLGAALMGWFRGVLSARLRFAAVGFGLAAENAVRALGAVALLTADVRDPAAYGLCLVLGYLAAMVFPSVFALGRTGRAAAETPLSFLGGTAGGQLLGQTVLTGGPVLLAALGGAPAEVTGLFAALAIFRAPYTLSLGLVSPLTGRLTALLVAGEVAAWQRLRRALLGVTGAGLLLAVAVGGLLGPWTVRAVFGADVEVTHTIAMLIAVGSAAALVNLVVSLMVLAHGRTSELTRSWLAALVPGAAWVVGARLADVAPLTTTAVAFAVVEVAALVVLGVRERRTPILSAEGN